MKRTVLLFIFCVACLAARAQVIRGRVLSGKTGLPVERASVYYDGTSIGTVTDSAGNFSLRHSPNNAVPMIISAVSYTSFTVQSYTTDSLLEVKLEPRVIQLKEISVVYGGKTESEMQKIFLEEFLGTVHSKGAKILNMDEIELVYDNSIKTLTASCTNPIRIRNPQLGYEISYTLEKFSSDPGLTSIRGYHYFMEIPGLSDKEKRTVVKNREKAYEGSILHFVRSLCKDELRENKFSLYTFSGSRIGKENLVIESKGRKYLRLNMPLQIFFKVKQSIVYPRTRNVVALIDDKGYFSPAELIFKGDMGKNRVGAMLPYDYQPEG